IGLHFDQDFRRIRNVTTEIASGKTTVNCTGYRLQTYYAGLRYLRIEMPIQFETVPPPPRPDRDPRLHPFGGNKIIGFSQAFKLGGVRREMEIGAAIIEAPRRELPIKNGLGHALGTGGNSTSPSSRF